MESVAKEMIVAGIAFIVFGIGYYFYRKRNSLSEATLDELERTTADLGFRYLPQYGLVCAFFGVIFLALGILSLIKMI